ncbi:MAG: hypothetical protein AAF429_06425 [Pseudomonadota bacterium]
MANIDFYELSLNILRSEWGYVQESIRALDETIFKIRGWAITLCSAGVAYAYVNNDAALCLYMTLPVSVFWIVDGLFKSFQTKFIERDREIRTYFASETFKKDFEKHEISQISITKAFTEKRSKMGWSWIAVKRHRSAMFLRNVVLSYVPIFILQLCTYWIITRQ